MSEGKGLTEGLVPAVVKEGDDVCIEMDAEMFRDLFELMTPLILTEVQVAIRNDGLYMKQMDESKTAMTEMFVPKTYFVELKAGKRIKVLRLPVSDVKKALTKLAHGDTVRFTVAKNGRLHVEIKGKRLRVFDFPLYEAEAIEKRTPKIPYRVRAKMELEGLLVAIEDAQRIFLKKGRSKKKEYYGGVQLVTTAMGISVTSKTEDGLYSAGTTLTSGWDIMRFEGGVGESVMIPVHLLAPVLKAVSKVTNMIQLEYTTDMPLHLIAELPFKGMRLEYWFAPRVLRTEEEVKE